MRYADIVFLNRSLKFEENTKQMLREKRIDEGFVKKIPASYSVFAIWSVGYLILCPILSWMKDGGLWTVCPWLANGIVLCMGIMNAGRALYLLIDNRRCFLRSKDSERLVKRIDHSLTRCLLNILREIPAGENPQNEPDDPEDTPFQDPECRKMAFRALSTFVDSMSEANSRCLAEYDFYSDASALGPKWWKTALLLTAATILPFTVCCIGEGIGFMAALRYCGMVLVANVITAFGLFLKQKYRTLQMQLRTIERFYEDASVACRTCDEELEECYGLDMLNMEEL